MDCPFCRVGEREPNRIVRETPQIRILMSDPKLMVGHLLVIPKRHVERIAQLDDAEREEFFSETVRSQERILASFAPGCDISQHYRPFIPDGPHKVTHLHMHIRPRSLDDELYLKMQAFERDVFAPAGDQEAEQFRELLGEEHA